MPAGCPLCIPLVVGGGWFPCIGFVHPPPLRTAPAAPAVPAAVSDVFVAAHTAMEAAVKMLKPGTKVGARAAVFVVMLVLVPVPVCPWLMVMASLRPLAPSPCRTPR